MGNGDGWGGDGEDDGEAWESFEEGDRKVSIYVKKKSFRVLSFKLCLANTSTT